MQDRMEESRLEQLAQQERERLTTHERELKRYREVIGLREQEFDAYRAKLKEEQLLREKELLLEYEGRERLFADREKKLVERQRDFERHLAVRESEAEALREHLHFEVANREAKLQQALSELQQEKERYKEESLKRIETNSKGYVSDALNTLEKKEHQFHWMSKMWSTVGAGGLAAGIGFFVYISLAAAISLPPEISWQFLAFTVFKGLIAVVLVAGLAKYSFLFSSYYMQEALKNADRRHAINFGKFYLESYGAAAEWSQVKEAFEHWNIANANAFTRSEVGLPDVTALEKAVALIERAGKAMPKVRSESST